MSGRRGGRAASRIVEAAILVALPFVCHWLFPVRVVVARPWAYLGAPVMLLGLALATWAAMTFRKAGTSYQLHGESSVLTTAGAFRISRNPMYLAMLIWLVGLAVLLGSLTAFLFPVLLFLLANFLIIPFEERNMERMFGEPYVKYRERVRRWL